MCFVLIAVMLAGGCAKGDDVMEQPPASPAPETSGKLMRDKAAIMLVQQDFLAEVARVGDKWNAYELSLRAGLSEYAAGRLDALGETVSTPKGNLIRGKFLELLNRHHDAASNWSYTLQRVQDADDRLGQLKEEGGGSASERTARQIEILKGKRDIQGALTGGEQAELMKIEHEIEKLMEAYK